MKVLFLDIDGVLNRRGTVERCGPYTGVDMALANQFTDWLKKYPEVSVVLSSAWRLSFLEQYDGKEHLHAAGIYWIDETPFLYDDRGCEIELWLKDRPWVTEFAILDDMNDMGSVLPYLVQTETDIGLTPAHLDVVERILRLHK
jgi:hypothetical protein